MKIGQLIVGYECSQYFQEAFVPWESVKGKKEHIISAVHTVFKENFDLGSPIHSTDNSESLFEEKYKNGVIDFYRFLENPSFEFEARNQALEPLLRNNVDIIWLNSLDEIYKENEILNTITLLEKNPFIGYFNINYRNYVFDKNHFIPDCLFPIIFRVKVGDYQLNRLYDDNDFVYKHIKTGEEISYKKLPYLNIPSKTLNPRHYTWLSDERSKNKVLYQERHFGKLVNSDSACSFKWNYELNKLELNLEHYKKLNLPVPEIKCEI